jgi:peptidoglycan-N-acetylglucosamine deacetylase
MCIHGRDSTSTSVHDLKMAIAGDGRGLVRALTIAAAMLLALPAAAQTCPGNPDALGTARTLQVNVATTPRVGRKQFPTTLPLAAKEIVLTFDDGPWPGTTPKVLDALKHACVRATFFLLGRNALAAPALARRELAEGHTIGYHTFAHPLLSKMRLAAADAEVDRGIAAVDRAAYGDAKEANEHPAKPHTPFFRFPGFAASPALLERMQARGLVVFGADLWASDWNPMTPEQELGLILHRLDAAGRGIILFHDTKRETARMLPAFLHAIRARGYHVVHVVPGG